MLPSELTTPRDERHGSKIGDLIRRLTSENEHEVLATVRAMDRTLKTAGADFHALAEHLEKSSVPDTEREVIWNTAWAAAVQNAQSKQHGTGDFRNTDGKPDWIAVALFLQRNKDRLEFRHHQFVDDMAAHTVWEHEPTERQHRYLHSLFFKLGGRLT
jgi:hypothetical protein